MNKTPAKTPEKAPEWVAMRPQAHGGSLRSGGFHGAGPGRRPSILKIALAARARDQLPLLDKVIRGQAIEVRVRVGDGWQIRRRVPSTMDRILAVELVAKMAGLWR